MAAHVAFRASSLARAFLVFGVVVQFWFAATASSAENSDSNDHLLELTGETFNSFVVSHVTTVIEFYQPW